MNADGTGQTRLTNVPANDSAPNFSPDGTRIVFNDRWLGEVYVMNADGSGRVNVTNGSALVETDPVFSPDGTRIATTAFTEFGDADICVMKRRRQWPGRH